MKCFYIIYIEDIQMFLLNEGSEWGIMISEKWPFFIMNSE